MGHRATCSFSSGFGCYLLTSALAQARFFSGYGLWPTYSIRGSACLHCYTDRAAIRRRRQVESTTQRYRCNTNAASESDVPTAIQPAVLSRVARHELTAKKKLESLRKAVEEQEALLETVRLQKQVIQPAILPEKSQARALERLLRKLPAVAAGNMVDLSTVFGSKLHHRGQQAWGAAWNEPQNGRPPIKDIFRVSPGDMVDLRNYLRQLIRNADEGVSLESSEAHHRTGNPAQQQVDSNDGFMVFFHSDEDVLQVREHSRPSMVPKLRLGLNTPGPPRPAEPPVYPPPMSVTAGSRYSGGAAAPYIPLLPSSPAASGSDASDDDHIGDA